MTQIFTMALEILPAVLCLLPIFLILHRYRIQNAKHTIIYILFAVYLVGVGWVTGLPNITYIRFDPNVNLIPFRDFFDGIRDHLLNVILFIPLGIFLPLLQKEFRRARACICFGALLSLGIEVLQVFTFRASDINDILTNTAGAAIGCFLGNILLKHKPSAGCHGRKEDLPILFAVVFFVMFFLHPLLLMLLWHLIP